MIDQNCFESELFEKFNTEATNPLKLIKSCKSRTESYLEMTAGGGGGGGV